MGCNVHAIHHPEASDYNGNEPDKYDRTKEPEKI